MHIWHAVQGEGSKLRIWSEPRVLHHPWLGQEIFMRGELGWWRDAGKLSWDRGRSYRVIVTHSYIQSETLEKKLNLIYSSKQGDVIFTSKW